MTIRIEKGTIYGDAGDERVVDSLLKRLSNEDYYRMLIPAKRGPKVISHLEIRVFGLLASNLETNGFPLFLYPEKLGERFALRPIGIFVRELVEKAGGRIEDKDKRVYRAWEYTSPPQSGIIAESIVGIVHHENLRFRYCRRVRERKRRLKI